MCFGCSGCPARLHTYHLGQPFSPANCCTCQPACWLARLPTAWLALLLTAAAAATCPPNPSTPAFTLCSQVHVDMAKAYSDF